MNNRPALVKCSGGTTTNIKETIFHFPNLKIHMVGYPPLYICLHSDGGVWILEGPIACDKLSWVAN